MGAPQQPNLRGTFGTALQCKPRLAVITPMHGLTRSVTLSQACAVGVLTMRSRSVCGTLVGHPSRNMGSSICRSNPSGLIEVITYIPCNLFCTSSNPKCIVPALDQPQLQWQQECA
jgi:hypothetical protein